MWQECGQTRGRVGGDEYFVYFGVNCDWDVI